MLPVTTVLQVLRNASAFLPPGAPPPVAVAVPQAFFAKPSAPSSLSSSSSSSSSTTTSSAAAATALVASLAQGFGAPLRSVVELVPQAQRFSEWWDRDGDCVDASAGSGAAAPESPDAGSEHSLLDHVLLSAGLWPLVVPGSAAVHNDHWPAACLKDGGFNSDHWPLTVDLALPFTASDDGGDGGQGSDDDGNDGGGAAAAGAGAARLERSAEAATALAACFALAAIAAVALAPRLAEPVARVWRCLGKAEGRAAAVVVGAVAAAGGGINGGGGSWGLFGRAPRGAGRGATRLDTDERANVNTYGDIGADDGADDDSPRGGATTLSALHSQSGGGLSPAPAAAALAGAGAGARLRPVGHGTPTAMLDLDAEEKSEREL